MHPRDVTMMIFRRCGRLKEGINLPHLYIIMLTTNKVNWDTSFISVNLMPLHVGQFIKSLNSLLL